MQVLAYICDELYVTRAQRTALIVQSLSNMASRILTVAEALRTNELSLEPEVYTDITMQQEILKLIRTGYGKIGDISLAYDIIKLTRTVYGRD